MENQNGKVKVANLPPLMIKLNVFSEMFNEEEIRRSLGETHSDVNSEIGFEGFLKVSFLKFMDQLFCFIEQ